MPQGSFFSLVSMPLMCPHRSTMWCTTWRIFCSTTPSSAMPSWRGLVVMQHQCGTRSPAGSPASRPTFRHIVLTLAFGLFHVARTQYIYIYILYTITHTCFSWFVFSFSFERQLGCSTALCASRQELDGILHAARGWDGKSCSGTTSRTKREGLGNLSPKSFTRYIFTIVPFSLAAHMGCSKFDKLQFQLISSCWFDRGLFHGCRCVSADSCLCHPIPLEEILHLLMELHKLEGPSQDLGWCKCRKSTGNIGAKPPKCPNNIK